LTRVFRIENFRLPITSQGINGAWRLIIFFQPPRHKNSNKSIAFAQDGIFVASLRQMRHSPLFQKVKITYDKIARYSRFHIELHRAAWMPHSSAILREQKKKGLARDIASLFFCKRAL